MGLRLADFTLGHWFLLARWTPALLDSEEDAETLNLPLAVSLCSLPWRKAATIPTGFLSRLFFVLWGWRCRKMDLRAEASAFRAYISDAMECPRFNRPANAGTGETNAPHGLWLLGVLMAEFGMSEPAALDTTWARALALHAARAESQGKVQLASARSRRLWEMVMAKRRMRETVANN